MATTTAQPYLLREPSEFPFFNNGDVLIIVPPSDVYKLHSDVLKRCSPKHMGALLASKYAAQLTKAAVSSGCFTRFKLALEYSEDHPNGALQRKEVDKFGRTATETNPRALFGNIYNESLPAYAPECWKNLLGAFYNIEPDMSGACFITVLEKSVRLMDTADSIGAAAAVRAYVDNSLMRQGQMLYRAVLANPISWGNLAMRVQSPSIFNDSVIHVVGRWNALKRSEKRGMNPQFRAICEQKAAQLYKIKGAIEMRITGHIPKVCWRQEGRDSTSRVSYANDVYMWMAISIHSRWFFQVTGIERRGRDGPDGGAALYRAVHEAGTSYLNVQDYVNFHNICPMSKKARTILYDKIRQVKYEVRDYVKGLVVNKSQLDLKDDVHVEHLLCTEMTPADLPWNRTDSDQLMPSGLSDDAEGEGESQREGGIPPNDTVFGSEIRPEGVQTTVVPVLGAVSQ
ncbi:hypothetical protein UA08_03852 [Talaromyces atroroseus]|uniref:BTB domain-containing protein n=1 Tax=Talaromyces atroroseus TaxID=1441469 RepID=A0A225B340_TALAT|nr:hypothetical protein UA08_03852 [Talaromyces atroroseus]OKL61235.1 hypothetical protein UA08_03852 [Talaromyces atroroseus]